MRMFSTHTERLRPRQAPASSRHRLGSKHLLLIALALLASCGRDSLLTAPGRRDDVLAPPPPPHYPIIFVHGFNATSATWTTMVARFKADGYTDAELVPWTYNFNQSNTITAQQLSAKIDSVLAATGAHHVDIIAHSMGSLSARYYVRNLVPTGSTKVDALISLAGANHGTNTALFCQPVSCVEMRPLSSFLKTLNSIDETWGAPRYGVWWSNCDEVISPRSSALLSGATVTTQTACLRHAQLHEDATVYAQVRDVVTQTPYGL
jgi:triacylglycerol lipase